MLKENSYIKKFRKNQYYWKKKAVNSKTIYNIYIDYLRSIYLVLLYII